LAQGGDYKFPHVQCNINIPSFSPEKRRRLISQNDLLSQWPHKHHRRG